MATNTAPASPPARVDPRQVANYISKTFNFNDPGISAGVAFANSLPAGAIILDVHVEVLTAFNGGTNAIFVGTNATSYNNISNGPADVNAAIVQDNVVARGFGSKLAAGGEVTPFVMYTQTGAAATTGKGVVTVAYTGGFSS
jgi:hypothetical protein